MSKTIISNYTLAVDTDFTLNQGTTAVNFVDTTGFQNIVGNGEFDNIQIMGTIFGPIDITLDPTGIINGGTISDEKSRAYIVDNGRVSSVNLGVGTVLTVGSTGTLSGGTANNGASIKLLDGSAASVTLGSGAGLVNFGGYTSHLVVDTGASGGLGGGLGSFAGGTDIYTLIEPNATWTVESGDEINPTVLGTLNVEAPSQTNSIGTLDGATILSSGTVDIESGAVMRGTTTIDGGSMSLASGSTIKSEIKFVGGRGTLTNAGTHNLTLAGFTSGDEIFLSGTSIPKSKHVTLGSKGVLTIGSVKETFVHSAGLVLNLTSTSSGVEVTALPAAAAVLSNNPKMDFVGTALTDEPLGETHLGNTSYAALLLEDFKATDMIGLKGADSSALRIDAPATSIEGAVATILFQNSTLAATSFNAWKGET